MAKTQAKMKTKSAAKARAAAKPARPKVVAKKKSAAKPAAKRATKPAPKPVAKRVAKSAKTAKAPARPMARVAPKAIVKPVAKVVAPARVVIPRPVTVKPAPPSLPARPAPIKPGPKPMVVKVAPMKPVPVEKLVLPSPKEYAEMRVRLELKRKEIMESYKRDLRVGQEANDEPTEDIVDRANNAYHRELMFSLSDSERQLLLQVEAALARFEAGTFGSCVHCGSAIALPRLQAIPWARLCINCQELMEKGLLEDN